MLAPTLQAGPALDPSAHLDAFARERLPPAALWPVLTDFGRPELQYPKRLNAAVELLDRMVERGFGARPCIRTPHLVWSYAELLDKANRIARVLVEDMRLVPGNRVLLRGANNEMMAACWLAVLKAGGIAVATMPLLRRRELAYIRDKAQISHALCDAALADELPDFERVEHFRGPLEARMTRKAPGFASVPTSHDDVALIAFTSGTTGPAKGTMHFHRDLLAICDCFPRSTLKPSAEDIFCGSPPLAFTFGLGGILLFPMRFGASTLLIEKPSAAALLEAIAAHRCTTCFTAPTLYRQMAQLAPRYDLASLAKCVSAGETLPRPVFEAFREATGVRIIDGIGATEMLHIFISAAGDAIRPGATGQPIPGYEAKVVDEAGHEVPAGTVGRLAVRGVTGCRYLDDEERQRRYVADGWNLTGDAYRRDEDGYFWYQARTDDMIISAGYNISGPEVEAVLLDHPQVAECAVVGAPDPERGEIVKAYVVPRDKAAAGDGLDRALQDWVKQQIAPYKYPREVEFIDALPRTDTGKVQRYKLRERARQRARA
jgi:2-aminobenzoate-CoA ligase